MILPTLVVVSGPPGSGKTTLAHELATAIPCPAICRDEIKEGMAHAIEDFEPAAGDALTQRTFPLFFAVIRLLLEHGVTVVAEAAFQDHLWRPSLEPLGELAQLVIIQCHVDPAVSRKRVESRLPRGAHADHTAIDPDDFQRLSNGSPAIDVDTASGYSPSIQELVAFVRGSS